MAPIATLFYFISNRPTLPRRQLLPRIPAFKGLSKHIIRHIICTGSDVAPSYNKVLLNTFRRQVSLALSLVCTSPLKSELRPSPSRAPLLLIPLRCPSVPRLRRLELELELSPIPHHPPLTPVLRPRLVLDLLAGPSGAFLVLLLF